MSVSRVVLDTNYLSSISGPELAAIRACGFVVSISALGISELWARARRESNQGLLRGPLNRVLPDLDAEQPILLGPGHIRHVTEPTSHRERTRRAAAHRAEGRSIVAALRSGTLDFEEAGRKLAAEIDEPGKAWRETLLRTRAAPHEGLQGMSREDAVRGLRNYFSDNIPMSRSERFDAYFAVSATIAVEHAQKLSRRMPAENDVEDLAYLPLVGLPTFIATWDLNMIRDVDASGTYQAPWIRTLGELLTDAKPSGLPWGRGAMTQAKRFVRRSRAELVALEKRVRDGFRGGP